MGTGSGSLAVKAVGVSLSTESVPPLEEWLVKHGSQLKTLQLKKGGDAASSAAALPIQLPWADLSGLRKLNLKGVQLPAVAAELASRTLSTNSSSTGVTPILPQLRQLKVLSCSLVSLDCLVQLAGSSGLTSLLLSANTLSAGQGKTSSLQPLLLQLPNVKHLQLTLRCSADVSTLGSMQQLRHVNLKLKDGPFGSCFSDLPSSLKSLVLTDARRDRVRNASGSRKPTLPPQLPQLTNLQHLVLKECRILPEVVGSLAALTCLHLEACILLPRNAQGVVVQANITSFLGAMQHLTQLKSLGLINIALCTEAMLVDDADGALLAQFSALTASSTLARLAVGSNHAMPLPQHALRHMFPAGRQLPLLTELFLWGEEQEVAFVWNDDLPFVFTACRALQGLELVNVINTNDSCIDSLLQLPQSCSRLAVGGRAFDDQSAATLAALTQLTCLLWRFSPELTNEGLEALTALQRLQLLDVAACQNVSVSTDGSLCLEAVADASKVCMLLVLVQLSGLAICNPSSAFVRLMCVRNTRVQALVTR